MRLRSPLRAANLLARDRRQDYVTVGRFSLVSVVAPTMSALCFMYFFAFGSGLAVAASLLEASRSPRADRRWLWLAVIAASVVMPVVYWAVHSSDGWSMWGHVLLGATSAGPVSAARGATAFGWRYCALSPLGLTVMRYSAYASAGFALWAVGSSLYVHRLLRRATDRVDSPAVALQSTRGSLIVAERLGPATVGVLRPRIVLPRWALALPPAQLAYVVRHEEEHRRCYDTALLCAAGVLVALMPWNIPLWWQLRRLRLAIETDCDRRVIDALGDADAYGQLLVRLAAAAQGGSFIQPALLGRPGMLELRVRRLVARGHERRAIHIAAVMTAALIAGVVLGAPHPMLGPTANHHHAHVSPGSMSGAHRASGD